VNDALEATKRLAGTPAGDTILYLFHSLETSLQDQVQALNVTGNTHYVLRCDGVLADLKSGRWDYRPSSGSEN
jgi:hypothetical protein